MAAPERLVVLDMGETLITGPTAGPARRIADRLGLPDRDRGKLSGTLMTTDFREPDAVATMITREFGTDPKAARVATAAVWQAQLDEAHALAGAVGTICELADESGLRLAILSNVWWPYLTSARRQLGEVIDRCIEPELQHYSCRRGSIKPSPGSFLDLLEAAGVSPDDAVMVGDDYRADIEGAAAVGMRTVWVLARPLRERAHLVRVLDGIGPAPDRSVASIGDLTTETITGLWAER